jgi:hypothetical protein
MLLRGLVADRHAAVATRRASRPLVVLWTPHGTRRAAATQWPCQKIISNLLVISRCAAIVASCICSVTCTPHPPATIETGPPQFVTTIDLTRG